MEKKRLGYVDVLRVIAMIAVVTCHYTRALEYAGISYQYKILPDMLCGVYLGDFGVAIFFVLSGISLMYTYKGKLDIKKYFKKRFLGIFPMFWIAWLLGFLYMFWKNGGVNLGIPRWKIILTLFGMDGYCNWYGPNYYILGEWFLGCIILLYLLFPIIKLGIEKCPIITAIIIMLIYYFGAKYYQGTIPVANFFLFRVPEFAFGMYIIHYEPKITWPVALISLGYLISTWYYDYPKLTVLNKNTLVGVTMILFVMYVCRFIKSERFYNVFAVIGKYSYAVFLTHHIIIQECAYHFAGRYFCWLDNLVMYTLCVVIVAFFTVKLYDLNKKVLGNVDKFIHIR